MSFGWSAGDIAEAIVTAYKIYQCFSDGPHNARRELSEFNTSFHFLSTGLQELNKLLVLLPLDQREVLTLSFRDTEKACQEFVDKHKLLTKGSKPLGALGAPSSSLSLGDRFAKAFQTVLWPTERATAEKLRKDIDTYVKAALLHATRQGLEADRAIYANTLKLHQDASIAHDERLEILQAVKQLGGEVERMLKICAPGTSPEASIDPQLIGLFSQQGMQRLSNANNPGRGQIPPPSPGSAALGVPQLGREPADQILGTLREFDQTMKSLVTRLTFKPSLASAEHHLVHDAEHVVDVRPVMNLVDSIRRTIDTALKYAGFHEVELPKNWSLEAVNGTLIKGMLERPELRISRAIQDWDSLNERTNYHIIHFPSKEKPRAGTPVVDPKSPDLNHGKTPKSPCAPLELQTPVTIRFPDPASTKAATILSDVQGNLKLHRHINLEVKAIVLFHEPTDVEITHTLRTKDGSDATTFIPWLYNRHVRGSAPELMKVQFKGNHQVQIRQKNITRLHYVNPVYIFGTEEDFETFQTHLLGKSVLYSADVRCVASVDATDVQCSLANVRILEDTTTHARTLLYFAEKRPFRTTAGFVEWRLEDFETAQAHKGSDGFRLSLKYKTRSSSGSISSTGSIDSHTSRFSIGSAMMAIENVPPTTVSRMKGLRILFYNEQERDAFKKALGKAMSTEFRNPFAV